MARKTIYKADPSICVCLKYCINIWTKNVCLGIPIPGGPTQNMKYYGRIRKMYKINQLLYFIQLRST